MCSYNKVYNRLFHNENINSFLFLIDYILFSIVVFTIICNLLNFVFNIAAGKAHSLL